jgi:hypothetical protein
MADDKKPPWLTQRDGLAGVVAAMLACHYALLQELVRVGAVDPDRYLAALQAIRNEDQTDTMKTPGACVAVSGALAE